MGCVAPYTITVEVIKQLKTFEVGTLMQKLWLVSGLVDLRKVTEQSRRMMLR